MCYEPYLKTSESQCESDEYDGVFLKEIVQLILTVLQAKLNVLPRSTANVLH